MQDSVLAALTSLAYATSDYETAWRAHLNLYTEDRVLCEQAMEVAHVHQRDARTRLRTLLGDMTEAYAIEAALVLATARVNGARPTQHRDHLRTAASGVEFLKETVREGGVA
jgi:hypothetical protein